MLANLRKRTEGFTIIEVLIVLAIAGVIMTIVFFAVPALQRNSRNTQLKNDASVILGYANDYAATNGGAMPKGLCYRSASGEVWFHSAAYDGTTCPANGNTPTAGSLVGKIRTGVTVSALASGTAGPNATGTLIVGLDQKCASPVTQAITFAPATRAIAVGFQIEAAGPVSQQCLES